MDHSTLVNGMCTPTLKLTGSVRARSDHGKTVAAEGRHGQRPARKSPVRKPLVNVFDQIAVAERTGAITRKVLLLDG